MRTRYKNKKIMTQEITQKVVAEFNNVPQQETPGEKDYWTMEEWKPGWFWFVRKHHCNISLGSIHSSRSDEYMLREVQYIARSLDVGEKVKIGNEVFTLVEPLQNPLGNRVFDAGDGSRNLCGGYEQGLEIGGETYTRFGGVPGGLDGTNSKNWQKDGIDLPMYAVE